ncbi:MAG TPA: VOC family protein [Candidatus Paceibacterota bacterium]|nr:VOC family protein [Candidatus Paceibacterota bacterium]
MIKFLHTRLRVGNLEKSIAFYSLLGFELNKRTPKSPQGNELAFMELPGNEHFLELAYSKDNIPKVPEDLVHTALGVPDLIAECDRLEKKGIEIWPANWREKFKTEKKMAFVTDPDGYEVELLER